MKINKNCILKGRRIILRPYCKEDIERWYRWFNDKEVIYYMDKGRERNTYRKQAQYLKKVHESPTDLQLAVVDKKTSELIGTIGAHSIDKINGNCDISILVGEKEYWHKGLGKEAVGLLLCYLFNKLGLHKVTAGMSEENKASYLLFRSLGFRKEAILREHVYLHGDYRDIIKLGLLKKEFKNRKD